MVTKSTCIPAGIEHALEHFARVVGREGFTAWQAGGAGDTPGHISLFDKDDNQHFYMYDEGRYYELVEVDGGADERK